MKFRRMAMGETVLVEAKMSFDEALKTLELSPDADADAIKQAFRKAAMKNHPDRGGSEEMMKKVNEAHDVLQDYKGFGGAGGGSKVNWEEMAAKYNKAAAVVVENLKRDFKPEIFDKYFEEQTGKKYTHKFHFTGVGQHNPSWAGVSVVWQSEDKETSFAMLADVYLADVVWPTPSLGGGIDYNDIGYNMGITTQIFHNNREVKFKRQRYDRTQLKSVLFKPEVTFPPKKIAEMLKGKDSARKFAKRDMLISITKKLDGRVSESTKSLWAYIPFGDPEEKFEFSMFRNTLPGRYRSDPVLAYWDGIDLKRKKEPYEKFKLDLHNVAQESEALVVELANLQKHVAKETDGHKIAKQIDAVFAKLKNKTEAAFASLKLGEKILVKSWKEDLAPQVILLMGLPAAGKSTFVKNELIKYYNHKMPHLSGFQTLNSDNQLRKYQWMQAVSDYKKLSEATQENWAAVTKDMAYKANDGKAVPFTLTWAEFQKMPIFDSFFKVMFKPYYASYFGQRAEAKKDSDELTDKKIKSGDVVILDSTGTNVAKMLSVFAKSKEMGSTNSVVWLDVPVEFSIGRDAYRGAKEGRSVGEAVIRSYEPELEPAFRKYLASDLVDRALKFKWVGELIKGKYQLVHDYKKYPKKNAPQA